VDSIGAGAAARGQHALCVRLAQAMNIFYLDGAALIAAPMSADHEIGLKYTVGGRPVGALPDSPNNAIVYQRDWPINR